MTEETRRTLAVAIRVVLGLGALSGGSWAVSQWVPKWSAGGSTPAPRDFRFLLFPPSIPNQSLLDGAGAPAQELRRAVLITDEQRVAGGLVDPHLGGAPFRVSTAELRFLPPAGGADLVTPLQRELEGRFEPVADEMVRFDTRGPLTRVTLRLHVGGQGMCRYVYDTDGSTATPVKVYGDAATADWGAIGLFTVIVISWSVADWIARRVLGVDALGRPMKA